MIYKKDANFPYPILTNSSNSYENCSFTLEVNLEENTNDYILEINYDITSTFITRLLENGQAILILVIKSKDNKFFNLDLGEKVKRISKSRISLSKRTTIQLFIQSKEDISFSDNDDLSSFYNEFKDEIIVPKNSMLGFSNCPMFDGSIAKPLELFEKKVNPNLKSDIKIEIGSETIIINYKNEELQFSSMSNSSAFNNPYVYMGLQKAMYRFIVNNGEDNESVDIDDMEIPEDSLDFKLYNLMKKKKIRELNIDNMDEVIYSISDKVIEKYSSAVRRLYSDGN
ncbi:hypothetical protein [Clostridium celatum]|uniref:Uncharacterized protein n=1 Tax=Clostridium celatum DSM 1785 TaxID=545697 RepID=L1QGB8_9CLOT|nr:hypothetical protein [Clostridium celatum]EKY26720.1 hypothetical protein HMPREF0216_01905 [Clostridium celatum DSM 1785]MCE9653741.1 hypothetical protein [Clostridium celatum]